MHSLFDDISNLDYLFMRLQFLYGVNLVRGKSVIIFDEVDFLMSKGTKINPIEVKSSGYKAHKSLDMFCENYRNKLPWF